MLNKQNIHNYLTSQNPKKQLFNSVFPLKNLFFYKAVEVVIPGNIATFTYIVEPLGNTVKVSSGINFKYSFIPAAYYPELKYFMGLVSSKLKEPVILKKTQQIASAKD